MACVKQCEIEEVLRDVLKDEGLDGGTFEVDDSAEKGAGYYGLLSKLAIRGRDGRVLHVVVKCAPRAQEERSMVPVLRKLYLREILFYKVAVPALLSFQQDRHVKQPFTGFARCLGTVDEELRECIVLENVVQKGFKLGDCKKQMDQVHAQFILEQYGKFHAISLAMNYQDPKLFAEVTKDMDTIFEKRLATKAQYSLFVVLTEKLKGLFDPESKVYEAVCELNRTIVEYVDTFEEPYKGSSPVITHGDCWCNNIMLKYGDPENPNRPTDLCLLDFQLAKPASPVLDISYFFYAMASKEMLDDLDRYLRIYHESLAAHLRELGSDVEKIYPFSALKDEWKQYAKFGFIMSLVVLKAMLREKDEVVDFTDGNEDGKTFISAFEDDIRSEAFAERQRNLVLHAYEIGII